MADKNANVRVTIKTSDGRIHTDPSEIFIPRDEKTEMFYRIVEQYKPEKNNAGDTA